MVRGAKTANSYLRVVLFTAPVPLNILHPQSYESLHIVSKSKGCEDRPSSKGAITTVPEQIYKVNSGPSNSTYYAQQL